LLSCETIQGSYDYNLAKMYFAFVENMKFRITKKHMILFFKRLGIAVIGLIILFFLLYLIFPLKTNVEYSTIITDKNGEVINAYLTKDQKWRMKTELDEISPLLQKTIIAKEDKYFYSHPGVNPVAVGRAFFKNIFRMKRTSGPSTITMQVARALEPVKKNFWTQKKSGGNCHH